ncbi:MAG: hypothetical protein LQ352_007406 [Teloschistes flavicans]|nr:MAG: hypothetical protein LQ352_007406 [Teloschistes flavicans]
MATNVKLPVRPPQDEWDNNREYHETLFPSKALGAEHASKAFAEECRTTPLLSPDAGRCAQATPFKVAYPQYGLLAWKEGVFDSNPDPAEAEDIRESSSPTLMNDDRLFLNLNVGFSAFICGSQGSGKSHTLSCILEAALKDQQLGKLSDPMSGIIFHWDRHTGVSAIQPCEAAYLCTAGIPVTVLVSPSNFMSMKQTYENLPHLPKDGPKPLVRPLLLRERHLNVRRMLKLMSVDNGNERSSLYIGVVCNILRELGLEHNGDPNLIYSRFQAKLSAYDFTPQQKAPLNLRKQLVESFLDGLLEKYGIRFFEESPPKEVMSLSGQRKARRWEEEQKEKRKAQPDIWTSGRGSLTIVDLSDPFVDETGACDMFNICLELFLENHGKGHTLIALDEAHKFMTESASAKYFTESLLSVVRLQRHHGTKILIATQEPTIASQLLDLCSMTIVHRFTSPEWLLALKGHLAAFSSMGDEDSPRRLKDIFRTIVNLDVGQALLFSASAMIDTKDSRPQKLGMRYVKMRVRDRLTVDGGKSVSAT